jgi:thiamine-monophosphate kinase
VLGRGFRSPRAVVEAYRVPQVAYGEGAVAAAAGATAMIDVSDGLLADVGHLAQASGVRIDLDTEALEIPEPLRVVAVATGTDPQTWVLTGGEDHALAATFPTRDVVPSGWQVIGTVTGGDSARGPSAAGDRVTVDGAVWEAPTGYDHFRSRR